MLLTQVHYLVDGGYVNNLPADVIKDKFGANTVIAVDVGAEISMTGAVDYGESLPGLKLLWQNLNPWAKPIKVTSLANNHSYKTHCLLISMHRLTIADPNHGRDLFTAHLHQECRTAGGRERKDRCLSEATSDPSQYHGLDSAR